jgi:hypothetical protein
LSSRFKGTCQDLHKRLVFSPSHHSPRAYPTSQPGINKAKKRILFMQPAIDHPRRVLPVFEIADSLRAAMACGEKCRVLLKAPSAKLRKRLETDLTELVAED